MTSLLTRVLTTILLSFLITAPQVDGSGLRTNTRDYKARFQLGIDVLKQSKCSYLRNKRVGLLTHPAGVDSEGRSTVDILWESPNVNLVALFGPEHGVYGQEKAEAYVESGMDAKTGLPVHSLYGKTRRPTPKMLEGIDTLVVDLQDIGTRSYTYVSCMRYAMEECFKQRIEVVVLDRPNPLGGLKVDGPSLDEEWSSYIGTFRVPYVHGLTIGELARIARDEMGWLRKKGKLKVIPMRGWKRDMLWVDTGLKWIPSSPNIPNLSAVLGYPMTGLGGQLGDFSHGIGTKHPFRLLTFSGKTAGEIFDALKSEMIPGLGFKIINYLDSKGNHKQGVFVVVTSWEAVRPTELSFYMMKWACKWSGENPFESASLEERVLYNKHVGCSPWWDAIATQGEEVNVATFMQKWTKEAKDFQWWSRKYWLYN